MPYTVTIQFGKPGHSTSGPFYPDATELFDFPVEARGYLLSLVADELDKAPLTLCRWIDEDCLEITQPGGVAIPAVRIYRVSKVSDQVQPKPKEVPFPCL